MQANRNVNEGNTIINLTMRAANAHYTPKQTHNQIYKCAVDMQHFFFNGMVIISKMLRVDKQFMSALISTCSKFLC